MNKRRPDTALIDRVKKLKQEIAKYHDLESRLQSKELQYMGVWKSNINVLTDDDPDICQPHQRRLVPARSSLQGVSVQ